MILQKRMRKLGRGRGSYKPNPNPNPSPNPNPNMEEEARNWLELPKDIISMIFQKLGAIEILDKAQYVCSLWRNICKDPLMWRVIDIRDYGFPQYTYFNLKKIFLLAIDRSCGGMIDINLVHFGPNDLLHYITQSSNQLRRIRLECCYNIITDLRLIEAVSKLPLLEHLEINLLGFDTATWETVGRCCPLLKTLKLSRDCFRRRHKKCDAEAALAIAENMPNLHHLQIIHRSLKNKGLQAIMDVCPDLESLDLRYCFNLNMKEQLGSECAETTKNLRFHDDPIDEYEFTIRIYDYDDTELSCEDFIHDYQLGDVDYPSGDESYFD